MKEAIEKAASFFDVSLLPSQFIGSHQRTIGQLAQSKDQLYWLRIVREESQWVQRDWWTGNEQANILTFISKPIVLRTYEWNDGNTRFRSELQTYKEGKVVSRHQSFEESRPFLPVGGSPFEQNCIYYHNIQHNGYIPHQKK